MLTWKYIDAIGHIDCRDDLPRLVRLRMLVLFTLLIDGFALPYTIYLWYAGELSGLALFAQLVTDILFLSILPILWITGSIRKTCWYMLIVATTPLILNAAITGGAESPYMAYLMVAPVFGGLLLGFRGAVASLLFNGAAVCGLISLTYWGVEPRIILSPESTRLFVSLAYLITLVILGGGTICFLTLSNLTQQELQEAKLAAEASAQTKIRFLNTMSHEIRTPLNGILGMAEVLSYGDLKFEQRERVDIIQKSGANLLSVINDVLDISKLDAMQIELESLICHPADMIQAAYDLVKLDADAKDLSLDIDVPVEMERIVADPTRIQQILVNLIGNAIKFTERGSISVSTFIACRSESGLMVRFEVCDTGIGIPQEKHSLLFDEFVQADCSTTRTYGGTGLGLTISRQLATLMGGEIGVESMPGAGATFWFTVNARSA